MEWLKTVGGEGWYTPTYFGKLNSQFKQQQNWIFESERKGFQKPKTLI